MNEESLAAFQTRGLQAAMHLHDPHTLGGLLAVMAVVIVGVEPPAGHYPVGFAFVFLDPGP